MRLERDVLAHSFDASYCPFYGRATFESASFVDSLYFGSPAAVATAVLRVQSEHGRGVFVIVDPGTVLRPQWQRILFTNARLQFVLPREALVGGLPVPPAYRVVAILATFGKFQWKAKRRRERVLDVAVQSELSARKRVGTQPVLVTRVSPVAPDRFPTLADDTAPPGKPAIEVSTVVGRRPPQWDVAVIKRWAAEFPCPTVAKFAIDAASTGIDSFVGDISKAIWQPTPRKPAALAAKCRESLDKEVAKGNTLVKNPGKYLPKG